MVMGHLSLPGAVVCNTETFRWIKRNEICWSFLFVFLCFLKINSFQPRPMNSTVFHQHNCVFNENWTTFERVQSISKRICSSNTHKRIFYLLHQIVCTWFIIWVKPNHEEELPPSQTMRSTSYLLILGYVSPNQNVGVLGISKSDQIRLSFCSFSKP